MVFEGFLLYGFYIDFNIDTIRLFRIGEMSEFISSRLNST